MRRNALLFLFVLTSMLAYGQLNMTLVSNLTYPADGNDVWAYVDPDDQTEYAIMGIRTGTSVVSLADPANPVEVYFVPGASSTWRDIKVWGDYAYVTTDQGADGLLVIDLSDAPDSYSHYFWTPNLSGLGPLEQCHNIWIDEFGYAYLSGCNVNNGGVLILDVFSQPGTPIYVNSFPNIYSHDIYVYGNIAYDAQIFEGDLTLYDVSDKNNIQFLGNRQTPYEFTHNTWLNEDKTVCFTTDERNDAPVTAYDITDPTDIVELDQFRPFASLGSGVIPHNVTTLNDWLIISYYTDGCIVADAALPDNIIEVGNFDTFAGGDGTFSGVWGVYPYLPSGLILASDINTGLYVFEPNYVRACYLEGTVTDGLSGGGLTGVEVAIMGMEPNGATTDLTGDYKTGVATAGTFDVVFTKLGYQTVTESVELQNGVLTILNVTMLPEASLTGNVVRDTDGNPVPNASVILSSNQGTLTATANGNGEFLLAVSPGEYDIFAGQWGYLHLATTLTISGNETITLELEEGYQDDFLFDLDWSVTGTANAGNWERVDPLLSTYQGAVTTPDDDIETDLGDLAYVTGNGGNGGSNDVDNGVVTLTSPVMDLTTYNQPLLSYYVFFYNGGGQGSPPDDALSVRVSNGLTEVEIESFNESFFNWSEQSVIDIANFIELTDNMRIIFETSDLPNTGHIVEAAVDAFLVTEGDPILSLADINKDLIQVSAFPNPSTQVFEVQYQLPQELTEVTLSVTDLSGKNMEVRSITSASGSLRLGNDYPAGVYFLEVKAAEQTLQTIKLVKQ